MSTLCWFSLLLLCIGIVTSQKQRPPDVTDPSQIPNYIYWNKANFSEGSQQLSNLDIVFEFLIKNTPLNGYATSLGYGNFLNPVFGHTACYNKSDRPSCTDCLRSGYNRGRNRLATGYRLWKNDTSSGCNMRYEIYNFTNSLPSDTLGILGPNVSVPSPAPAATGGSPNSTRGSTPGIAPAAGSSANNIPVILGAVVGSAFVILVIFGALFLLKRRKRRKTQRFQSTPRESPAHELFGAAKGPVAFTYRDLYSATNSFSEQNKLGQGGFGPVYKAQLDDGTHVAVKQLSLSSQQGKKEFVNEISIITSIQHRNLVKLIGYCAAGDHRLLVYEFLENGSLDRALFANNITLDWQTRVQIVIGVAKGLAYLHEESHIQIIHRDIKASNILLDRNLQAKISDFGISKLEDAARSEGVTTTTTRLAGTLGYMAPEYVTRGRLSSKLDVFSFGILILEIVSGRKSMDSSVPADEEILLQKTWSLCSARRLEELFDPRLEENYDVEQAGRVVNIAMLCTQEFEDFRPVMSQVVAMLNGFLEKACICPKLINLETQTCTLYKADALCFEDSGMFLGIPQLFNRFLKLFDKIKKYLNKEY